MERKPDWLPGFPVQIYCNSEATMKLPYGYVLIGEEIVVHEEKADK